MSNGKIDTRVDALLRAYRDENVDIKSFAREFLKLIGGMPGLARMTANALEQADVGSTAHSNLLRQAMDLLARATPETSRAAEFMAGLNEADVTAVLRKVLDGKAAE